VQIAESIPLPRHPFRANRGESLPATARAAPAKTARPPATAHRPKLLRLHASSAWPIAVARHIAGAYQIRKLADFKIELARIPVSYAFGLSQ